MKKSTIALLVCFVFALGMVYTPSAEAANGDLLAQIIGKIKAVVEKIKENKACKADPESCVEPPEPPLPPVIVIPEPQPASPNAFGEPTTALRNPGTAIQMVRGVRSTGWTEQTRSEILARNGVVTTSSGHASAAGMEILLAGGNAIDAAVATMAMIALTEPYSTNLGGDMFAIIYDAKTKQLYQISANCPAPKNYNREFFAANGYGVNNQGVLTNSGSPSTVGIWSAMIPLAPDGWDKMLKRFGNLTFKEVLEPARKKSIEGFPLEEIVANTFYGARSGLCNNDPDTAKIYCINGNSVTPLYGIFKNPDMANTLKVLQDQGVDGFYRGEVAEAAVAKANSLVKLPEGMTEFWQLSDFADAEARWIEPLTTNYRGYDLYETPPPSQGWAALEMMNIIEVCAEVKGLNLRELGRMNPMLTHLMVEAKKLAYSDLHRYNADPRYFTELNDLLPQYFLNKEYAYSLCDLIDTETPAARPSDRYGNLPGGTIYGASADRWGNMVSFVFSVYTSWGSYVTVPGYGFQFTSRGTMFTFDQSHPNTVEGGGKEPFITIIAGFIMKDGEPVMALGNMGGSTQPLGHAQHFVNMIDFGFNVQATSDAARWDHSQGSNGTTQGGLSMDYYLYDAMAEQLRAWGHSPSRSRGVGGGYEGIYFKKDANEPEPTFGTARKCEALGNGQALCSRVPEWIDKPVNGVYRAGSDTLHKDAAAMGW